MHGRLSANDWHDQFDVAGMSAVGATNTKLQSARMEVLCCSAGVTVQGAWLAAAIVWLVQAADLDSQATAGRQA
jgi:hypothetical protein